jgi:hypothetical protein
MLPKRINSGVKVQGLEFSGGKDRSGTHDTVVRPLTR